ncbi:MAG: VCBS repeat-containing protein [Gemmatimonadota bacterium]
MHTKRLLLSAVLLLAGCGDDAPPPAPGFDPVFPLVAGERMSNSSPNLIDLNGDGALDIVYGSGVDRLRPEQDRYVFSGEPEIPGFVTAVSGADNSILWRVPHAGEAFTTPRFADLNGDGVQDVLMGGREGALAALNGRDGTTLWRARPDQVADTPVPYNFFTPALIGDRNGDGVDEIVVVYGGDDTRLPDAPREAAWIAVLSGADGALMATFQTPDGNESYSSIVVYERPARGQWLIFGTGGETHGGAAFRAPVSSLLDGSFAEAVETLVPAGTKGVMAPATLVELTGDAELDIVISTFDGRLFALDGAAGGVIWERADPGEEAYHPAAVMRVARDGRLGLVVSRGVGTFPGYTGSVHRVLDARDGTILYSYTDPFSPAGAPLAVDLTGDGIDEPFFFSLLFPRRQGGRVHILHGASGELIVHDLPFNFGSTPHIADPRGAGTLELIGVSWSVADSVDSPDWRHTQTQLHRLDLSASTPSFRSWAAYMGTYADGRWRAPPGR